MAAAHPSEASTEELQMGEVSLIMLQIGRMDKKGRMSVLIIKCAALGDVLRTTSLLRPLKARCPNCIIYWVTEKQARPLLLGNPWVRSVLTLEQAEQFLSRRFDLVLSLEETRRAARLANRCAGGDLIGVIERGGRLSYTKSSALYYDMSLLNGEKGDLVLANALKSNNRFSYAELWLKILELPMPSDRSRLRPVLELYETDRAPARAFARKHGLGLKPHAIGFNPGAGPRWPAKSISEDKAVKIIHALHRECKRPILLLGGAAEADRNSRILKRVPHAALNPGVGHALRPFAALIDLCAIILTTDSLTFHIATALGKPAFVFVGPTSAAELDTFGKGAKFAAKCSCFYQSHCAYEGQPRCLDQIPIPDIVRKIRKYL